MHIFIYVLDKNLVMPIIDVLYLNLLLFFFLLSVSCFAL